MSCGQGSVHFSRNDPRASRVAKEDRRRFALGMLSRFTAITAGVAPAYAAENDAGFKKHYGIDESYIGPYKDDQIKNDQDMIFIGGSPGYPDFGGAIHQNGEVVTSAEIIP